MNRTARSLLVLLALAGCAPSFDPVAYQERAASREQPLNALTYLAVDRMFNEAPDLVGGSGSVIVGSVEDIHDVDSSTPFGNIISEMIRTRLVQKGINVQELRVRSSVLLERHSGELLLSRDKRTLVSPPAVSEYVTGTYAVASGKVYVSLKIIDARAGRIKAASDFITDRTLDVDQLLARGRS